MKCIIFAISYIMLLGVTCASIDASIRLKNIKLSFLDYNRQPASITLTYNKFNSKKELSSISVVWRDSTIVIPEEELKGLSDMQIDSIELRAGAYNNGETYHYVDALYGEQVKGSKSGYKRVWLLMGTSYTERKTFITLPTKLGSHFKQLTHKLSGKPETKLKK